MTSEQRDPAIGNEPPQQPSEPDEGPDRDARPLGEPTDSSAALTRAGAAWVAVGVALALLVLLVVFILQNQEKVEISFLGFSGTAPLGVALLAAAVAAGILVGVAGAARVMQLRHRVRSAHHRD